MATHPSPAPTGLLAGAARREITPPLGVEMMGYGARVGVAAGVHDPLYARALCLGDVILVAADLCLITPEQARATRERISELTGAPAAGILISCTHTHSGPDTGLGPQLRGQEPPGYVEALFEGMVLAAVAAREAREPATLGWIRAEARIGRNRRLEHGPIDPEVLILEVRRADGAPLAVLFDYACHGTVLGHDNLEISADWAGVACELIGRETGAHAQFLLGAHADIDPRTRGLMDPAIDGQSLGLGFDAVRVLGSEVAEAVLGALGRGVDRDPEPALAAGVRSVRASTHLGALGAEGAAAELARRKAELCELLGVSGELPRTRELFGLAARRAESLPISQGRDLQARLRLYLRDRTAERWLGGQSHADIELQVLRIGETALLALPLEPTTEVGLDWKARAGTPRAAVAGIGNGWLRYLPHSRDFADPLAHHHYEVLSSLFTPGTCEALLGEASDLLDGLMK